MSKQRMSLKEKLSLIKSIHELSKAREISLTSASEKHGIGRGRMDDIQAQLESRDMWPVVSSVFPPGTKLYAGLPGPIVPTNSGE